MSVCHVCVTCLCAPCCVCVCVCVCVCACVRAHVCVSECEHACMHACVYDGVDLIVAGSGTPAGTQSKCKQVDESTPIQQWVRDEAPVPPVVDEYDHRHRTCHSSCRFLSLSVSAFIHCSQLHSHGLVSHNGPPRLLHSTVIPNCRCLASSVWCESVLFIFSTGT